MTVTPIGTKSGLAAEHVEILRKRVRHAQWRGRRLSDEEVFVLHYRFQPELMPGFSLRRVRRLPLSDGSVLVQATATQDSNPARVLRIEAYEMQSVDAAHDRLVELLGSFEFPPPTCRRSRPASAMWSSGSPAVPRSSSRAVILPSRSSMPGRRDHPMISQAASMRPCSTSRRPPRRVH